MGSKSLTITVPIPGKGCNPNHRCHWAVKSKHNAAARASTVESVVSTIPPSKVAELGLPWRAAAIKIRWFHPTKRHRDSDNIISSCKAIRDGLIDAAVLVDDDQITSLTPDRLTDRKNPRVELVVTKEDT